jgi:hypothetical protein
MNAKGQPGRVDATSSGKSRSYAIAFSSLAYSIWYIKAPSSARRDQARRSPAMRKESLTLSRESLAESTPPALESHVAMQ